MKTIIEQDLKNTYASLELAEDGSNDFKLELYYSCGDSLTIDSEEWEMLKEFVDEHWKRRIVISQEYEIAKRKGEEWASF